MLIQNLLEKTIDIDNDNDDDGVPWTLKIAKAIVKSCSGSGPIEENIYSTIESYLEIERPVLKSLVNEIVQTLRPMETPLPAGPYCCLYYHDRHIYASKICNTLDKVLEYARSKAAGNPLKIATYMPVNLRFKNITFINQSELSSSQIDVPENTICEIVWNYGALMVFPVEQ